MTQTEALKLALEVLVEMTPSGPNGSDIWHKQMSAITALSDALNEDDDLTIAYMAGLSRGKDIAKQKPLTDEEITQVFNKAMAERPKDASNAETNRLFVRAIEAKLKEKNNTP